MARSRSAAASSRRGYRLCHAPAKHRRGRLLRRVYCAPRPEAAASTGLADHRRRRRRREKRAGGAADGHVSSRACALSPPHPLRWTKSSSASNATLARTASKAAASPPHSSPKSILRRARCATSTPGHNDPILRRASGQIERLSTGGPPFGVPLFHAEERSYRSGARAAAARRSAFHFHRRSRRSRQRIGRRIWRVALASLPSDLLPAGNASAADVLRRVMFDVNTFVGYVRQHDDITCLVLRVTV